MKEPAFMLFPTEFIMETSFMTKTEVCDYIRILCNLHFYGHLPLKKMEKICGGKISQNILDNLEKDEEGLYYNKRMEYEAQKRSEYSDSRRKNASTKKRTSDKIAEPESCAEEKKPYGPYNNVMLTDSEYEDLSERFSTGLDARIKQLSDYMKMHGKSYDCHYAVIISWDEKNKEKVAEEMKTCESTFDTDDFFNAAVERSRNWMNEHWGKSTNCL